MTANQLLVASLVVTGVITAASHLAEARQRRRAAHPPPPTKPRTIEHLTVYRGDPNLREDGWPFELNRRTQASTGAGRHLHVVQPTEEEN